jgi:uncharacterized phiE125 gp8 family phage protein
MIRSSVPRLRLVTDATSEPITLADAKAFCRVDIPDEDALITSLISAARRYVEKETGLALNTQTWAAVLDRWPEGQGQGFGGLWWDGVQQLPISLITSTTTIEIPKRPFQSITHVKLRDAYGTLTTVDSSVYFTEVSDMRGRVNRVLGQIWPVVILANSGAVEITFTAGFDAAPYSGLPEDLKQAIYILVKHWFDNREPVSDGRMASVPSHIFQILQHWKSVRLA